ncbi:MAG TPA: L,D-transpeptidase [Beijerinckiaceae bacterium]|nr:L,D-transpeptidase [Beijerinckiaceae bacterium]
MRRSLVASIVAAVGILPILCLPARSLASERQPHVIVGVGPRYGESAPVRVGSPAYGGGLIQLLITGREPGASRAVYYNRPEVQVAPPSPARIQQAFYAPAMATAGSAGAVNPIYQRREVAYDGSERPGTVVVDTEHKFLFFVLGGGKAMRYGIGVGRPGFEWTGVKTISRKARWPAWTPPEQMRLRIPTLPVSMPGGPNNPLGARALYLGSSLYRIHGTNQPETIGRHMSSGCIRMMNDDVKDLYERVKVGTKVVVI